MTLGLRELNPAQWLEFGPDSESQILERQTLIAERQEVVYQSVPGHDSGVRYFVDALKNNLERFHPDRQVPADISMATHPLLTLASYICEDLCVLCKIDGKWILVAAVVIFPSRWDVREKIGLDIDAIHRPVPDYTTALQPLMSDTFDRIKIDRPAWRRNWSLHATAKLHEPQYEGETSVAEKFWWRTERQTLTKSADDKYLLFTIRNRAEPLAWIKEDPEAARSFAQTLESLSPEMLEYKRITVERDSLLNFLRT
ncbi:MAG: hypothetical protein RLZZ251_620 [Actinomycetota bacterium]|jgi:hypothetical protein